jgi:hypothetical protein
MSDLQVKVSMLILSLWLFLFLPGTLGNAAEIAEKAEKAKKEVLFSDDFDSDDLSFQWSGARNCIRLKDGKLIVEFPGARTGPAAYGTNAYLMLAESESWLNYEIETKMRMLTKGGFSSSIPHIVFRKQRDNYKHYAVSIWEGRITLSKSYGRGDIFGKTKLDPYEEHKIRVSVKNLENDTVSIAVHCDDKLEFEYLDESDPYLCGPAGLFFMNCTAQFDYFRIFKEE